VERLVDAQPVLLVLAPVKLIIDGATVARRRAAPINRSKPSRDQGICRSSRAICTK